MRRLLSWLRRRQPAPVDVTPVPVTPAPELDPAARAFMLAEIERRLNKAKGADLSDEDLTSYYSGVMASDRAHDEGCWS